MPDASIHLREPVLTGALAAPRFFNGRLLSGDALTQLQEFEQAQRRLLGAALGAGVVDGLWVEPVGALARLRVRAGEALNGQGEVLRLAQDVEVDLTEPTTVAAATAGGAGFQARASSKPPDGPAAVPGAFVLIAGVARQPRGRAPVSAGTTAGGPCNAREDVVGVAFRAAPVVSPQPLPSGARLRGDVAALCFGLDAGQIPRVLTERMSGPPCLLPAVAVGPSEVALAVFHVEGGGVAFVDNWAARRRVAARAPSDPTGAPYGRIAGDERRALTEAMAFHFQELLAATSAPVAARDVFAWLPPAGVIPEAHAAGGGWRALLGDLAPSRTRRVAPETLVWRFAAGLERTPIDLSAERPAPVDVYETDDGAVIFARSAKARLRATGPASMAKAALAARPVDPDDHDLALEDGWRRAVAREVDGAATCTLDLEPGTYEVSVNEGLSDFLDLRGGETRPVDLEHP